MANSALITLGGGDLSLDAVATGILTGPVVLRHDRSQLRFPPSDVSLQDYTGTFTFEVDEQLSLKCAQAELSQAALKLTLGLGSGDLATVTGSPSYNPASFQAASSTTSYDVIRLGHNSIGVADYQSLLFEHVVPNSSKTIALILYRVFSRAKFNLTFDKRDIVIQDCEWIAVPDNSRPVGDRTGMIIVQE